jgi:hypothetical protein
MAMLADHRRARHRVDTHKHPHTAALVVAATGAVIEQVNIAATLAGCRQLLRLADRHDGRRGWAIEGTGGYGAGLTRFLQANAEQVVELDRPTRAARRHGATSDPPGRDQGGPRSPGPRAARPTPGRRPPRSGCRCGWPPTAPRSRPPPTPNANSTPW